MGEGWKLIQTVMSQLLKHLNLRGFTMIEVMVVLLLITVIVTVSAQFIYRSIIVEESLLFEHQLTQDLYQAQLTAITSEQYVSLRFYPLEQQYHILTGSGTQERTIVKRELPLSVELLETSTLLTFRFLPSGSTSTFGAIRFRVNEQPYTVHFYLGKGRFYVEK